MTVDTSIFQSGVLFAAGGALVVELLKLAETRSIPRSERPDLTELLYWLPFIIFPILGGFLAYMHLMSDVILKPFLAVNIGASAPLMVRTMASAIPKTPIDAEPGA
jgi:hypothetical protein